MCSLACLLPGLLRARSHPNPLLPLRLTFSLPLPPSLSLPRFSLPRLRRAGYQNTLPFSSVETADLWEVNSWLRAHEAVRMAKQDYWAH